MKDKLIVLFTLILALARTPKDQDEHIDKQKKKIQEVRDEIDTLHGDEDFNSDEVSELINDIITVAATSEPDEEYAEIPADTDDDADTEDGEGEAEAKAEPEDEDGEAEEEAPRKPAAKKRAVAAEEDEEEPAAAEEEDEEPAPETPKQRRLRLEAEAARAKKSTTIKKRH